MKTSHLKQQHWRKSQQWFVLNRAHAELVVADHHVKEVFKRYCWSYGKHICVSDEHYIPTLLASYDLDDQVCTIHHHRGISVLFDSWEVDHHRQQKDAFIISV